MVRRPAPASPLMIALRRRPVSTHDASRNAFGRRTRMRSHEGEQCPGQQTASMPQRVWQKDQREHWRRNIRLCVTPCPTRSCLAMKKRANIAYLIYLYCTMTRKPVQ